MSPELEHRSQVRADWNHAGFSGFRLCGRQHDPPGLSLFVAADLAPLERQELAEPAAG